PYASSYGIPELRQAWQKLIKEKNPSLKTEISLPVVTNGLTHGLSIIGYLFVDPGNKCTVSNIHWENYELIFNYGYNVTFLCFNTFNGTGLDTEDFSAKLAENPGKQIILMNFPHNPTGYTLTDKEADDLVSIIKKSAERGNTILVINDDAYFGLVYQQGIFRESLFSRLADLHENVLAVKIDGATKEDYAWGFRVGFITYASKGIGQEIFNALEDKTTGAIRGNISSASHISQSILLNALSSPRYLQEKKSKYDLLKSRYKAVREVLSQNQHYSDYFSPLPFNSGYFMCIQLKKGLDSEIIRQLLLKKYDTGVVATGNLLRVAFSSVAEQKIPCLFENIYQACKEHLSS
ncbi:aminotransferase class I/II-fold pyridoxal phosphate-dependent enzyme, partial [bacterium]|nr:aminotransferase class I/II-fold pyridoxal phosphate-dependent enzyme [bacterium]